MHYEKRLFLHPVPLAAVALMALNDHLLKYQFPGWITGKLSDFCGIFYFPIFILALEAEICRIPWFHSLSVRIGRRINVLMTIAFADILLVTVKLSEPAARLIETFFADYLFKIQLIQDPTDLLALLMNPMTFLFVSNRWGLSRVARHY